MKNNSKNSETRQIVFVNQATGYLTIDIINCFAEEFDKVAVIYGDIRYQDTPLHPNVIHSKVIEKSRKSNFQRLFRWVVATLQIFYLLITKYRRYEIFYFSVPPFAYLSSLLLRRRFTILMWDVYPDALTMIGIKEKNLIYRLWGKANEKLFKRAYKLYTIGDALKEKMTEYVKSNKIFVVPIWSGISGESECRKAENPFIRKHNLEGKFIIQYSGNIGAGHNIETLIEAAKLTVNDEEILYLIVGRGTKMDTARYLIKKYNLTNCRLLSFQPDDMIKYSLSAADLNVVLIEDKLAKVSIPSKVYNLMAVGSPIISIAPQDSEICKMINLFGNGRNFEKNDVKALVTFIRSMKKSPGSIESYRERSFRASQCFQPANSKRILEIYKDSHQ